MIATICVLKMPKSPNLPSILSDSNNGFICCCMKMQIFTDTVSSPYHDSCYQMCSIQGIITQDCIDEQVYTVQSVQFYDICHVD